MLLAPGGVITLTGLEGAVLFGYHTAAHLGGWRITAAAPTAKAPPGSVTQWTLVARIHRADRFQLQQRPLRFTAPRNGGYWCWPLVAVTVGETELRATLGKPEQ